MYINILKKKEDQQTIQYNGRNPCIIWCITQVVFLLIFFLMKIHAKTTEKDNSHREDVACLPCLATKGGGAIDLKYY